MLYSLIMLITINGQSDGYSLDHGLTLTQCKAALAHTKSAPLYRGPGVVAVATFSCDKGR